VLSSKNQHPRRSHRQRRLWSTYRLVLAGYSLALCVCACGRERLVAVELLDASSSGGSPSGGGSSGGGSSGGGSSGGGSCGAPNASCDSGVSTPPNCRVRGTACNTSAECCSGACSDPGTGISTCQALDGCLPTGELCGSGTECCSQICSSSAGVPRCQPAPNCVAIGDVCTRSPQGSNCCSGFSGGPGPGRDESCEISSAGVSRCMMLSFMGQCLSDSSKCHIHEECCSRFCLPNDSGQFTCAPGCAAAGARCGASRDCCNSTSGTSCVDGTCQSTGGQCRQLGVDCGTNEDCCSRRCDLKSCVIATGDQAGP
jgi:hypothetical protein